eukprot:6849-Rhodomonas_salina.2
MHPLRAARNLRLTVALRIRYALSSTDPQSAPTRVLCEVRYWAGGGCEPRIARCRYRPTRLHAMSGTDLAHGGIVLRVCYAKSGTDLAYGGIVLRVCYAMSGTVLSYASAMRCPRMEVLSYASAMRCPVLTYAISYHHSPRRTSHCATRLVLTSATDTLCYACAMRCPVLLSSGTALRICYTESGIDLVDTRSGSGRPWRGSTCEILNDQQLVQEVPRPVRAVVGLIDRNASRDEATEAEEEGEEEEEGPEHRGRASDAHELGGMLAAASCSGGYSINPPRCAVCIVARVVAGDAPVLRPPTRCKMPGTDAAYGATAGGCRVCVAARRKAR